MSLPWVRWKTLWDRLSLSLIFTVTLQALCFHSTPPCTAQTPRTDTCSTAFSEPTRTREWGLRPPCGGGLRPRIPAGLAWDPWAPAGGGVRRGAQLCKDVCSESRAPPGLLVRLAVLESPESPESPCSRSPPPQRAGLSGFVPAQCVFTLKCLPGRGEG